MMESWNNGLDGIGQFEANGAHQDIYQRLTFSSKYYSTPSYQYSIPALDEDSLSPG
jgi:hypothetical protein